MIVMFKAPDLQRRGATLEKEKKKPRKHGVFNKLSGGLEPPTHALRMRCATNCATEAIRLMILHQNL